MPEHEQVSPSSAGPTNLPSCIILSPPSLSYHTYSDLFNGTVILREVEEEDGYLLDVEGDSSEVYGPPQYLHLLKTATHSPTVVN